MEIALGIAIGFALALAVLSAFVMLRRTTPSGSAHDYVQELAGVKSRMDGMATGQDALRTSLVSLESALRGLETRMVESTGSVKESVLRDFADARRTLEAIRTEMESRKQLERDLQQSSRRIEMVIAGGRSRGRAGENILAEAFKQFPPNVVETSFRVNGHPVEYALVLVDGKRVPIDSKWTASDLVEGLEQETEPAARERLLNQIEQAVQTKVREVTKYIDPSMTTSWGVAAVPDAVFNVCRNAHLNAFGSNVILMPFSLAVVYLLSLYQLHLQYCRSVDIDKIEGYLNRIEQGCDRIDVELENKVSRGATMIVNAFEECKRQIGSMRGAAAYLRSLPGEDGSATPGRQELTTDDADPAPSVDPPAER